MPIGPYCSPGRMEYRVLHRRRPVGLLWLTPSRIIRSTFATTDSGGASERVSILVDGIDSASAYGITLAYLRGLDIVQSINVLSVGSGRVTIEIDAQGGISTLARLVGIGNVMRPAGTGDDAHFRLRSEQRRFAANRSPLMQ